MQKTTGLSAVVHESLPALCRSSSHHCGYKEKEKKEAEGQARKERRRGHGDGIPQPAPLCLLVACSHITHA